MPISSLEQVYKSFIRPVIEYADVVYSISPFDNNVNKHYPLSTSHPLLMDKLESIQYQAALAITGTWKCSSKEKVYNLLGWEFFSKSRWVNQMVLFLKLLSDKHHVSCERVSPECRR